MNATGIDSNLPISVACGVERDFDRTSDVARHDMEDIAVQDFYDAIVVRPPT